MKKFVRSALLTATILTPGALMAQTVAGDEGDREERVSAASGNEIVVTARKTEERLQEAPLAVAVVTADGIDRLGFNSVTDLTRATAGLVFDESFGRDANRPVIRGQANILGDSGVAFFIDGSISTDRSPITTSIRLRASKWSRGRKSALYGRNTYSGAINIITKSPGDRWSGRVQADVSEGMAYDISGSVSGPLAPRSPGPQLSAGAISRTKASSPTSSMAARSASRKPTPPSPCSSTTWMGGALRSGPARQLHPPPADGPARDLRHRCE